MEHRHIRGKRISAIMLCVLLSLLLHLLLAFLLVLSSSSEENKGAPAASPSAKQKFVRIQRTNNAQREKRQQIPFAKTSADAPQSLPERTDYEGSRNTRAASAPDTEHLRSEKDAPAQRGEKKDEIVTFEQERQDGPLDHEGQKPQQPPTPPLPPDVALDTLPHPESPRPPAPGRKDATGTTPIPHAADKETLTAPTVHSREKQEETEHGELLISAEEHPEEHVNADTPAKAAAIGSAAGTASVPAPPQIARKKRPVFFDPSLASAQPNAIGFRTTERRSRSSGRFVVGKGAALNVSATPLGRYESEIYRRIAYFWYRACDDHRGDIIPGSITISLRINKRGHLENMDLVRRHGAGVIQQSFTFRAIRQATLPPMPTTVRQEIVGDLLELIFTFNFD